VASRRIQRLRAAIETRGVTLVPPQVAPEDVEAQRIEKHLELARAAAREGRISEGWGHLHLAEEIRVGLVDADELAAIAVDLRREATDSDKFSKWRGRAILDHLGRDDAHPVKVCDVQHALRIRLEHFDNLYNKIDETANLIAWANVALVVLLALLLGLTWYGVLPLEPASVAFIGTAMLMGALGGALSTGLSLVRPDSETSIPGLQRQGAVTFFRPALGAAMAAVTYVFIKAGLLDFLGSEISGHAWLMAAFGFVAGFSERWFMGIVSRFAEDSVAEGAQPKDGGPADT
jgi:hypothetical protein